MSSRAEYLQRPDLGRILNTADAERLREYKAPEKRPYDAVFIVGDGLSASAVQLNALGMLREISSRLTADQVNVGPVVLAQFARVALGDEIGAALGARLAVVLIGERPGLSAPDSLGIYLTYDPKPGRTDAQRNCISNIRAQGLSFPVAADKLHFLITEALQRKLSGVNLKENASETIAAPSDKTLT